MGKGWRASDDLPNGKRRPRGSGGKSGGNKPIEIDPPLVRKLLAFSLRCQQMPKIDTADPEAVRERVNWYFGECMKEGIRPGVEGLCNALHVNRGTFTRWASGVRRAGSEQQAIIQDAKQILADMMEQYMLNGEINPVAGIFLASNQFDYDRNATVTVQTQPLISEEDPKRLAEKYRSDIIDVDAEPAKVPIETTKKGPEG